jgi:lambda repressor-like predicted transcriptional regulator
VLKAQGHSLREISRLLQLARNTVRHILRQPPPEIQSERSAARQPDARSERIATAFAQARGNAVRAQQLLAADGIEVAYSSLTRWIREAELREPPRRAGEYSMSPGSEAQHDTSPHRVLIGDRMITAQCASWVLAYSRRLFVQYFQRYTRFEAKHFLLEAARFMDGTPRACIIDNSSVILAAGSGADAIVAPEMAAFARTLGFEFRAHRLNHPDRKGRVERPFYFVETNFLPGRQFRDFDDLNIQVLSWCREVANQKPKRILGMSPEAAYLMEKPHLQALPGVLPPVYEPLEREVDVYGYVSVDTNRYSAPERLIGKSVTVHKYFREIQIWHRGTLVATHARHIGERNTSHRLAGHHSALNNRVNPGLAMEEVLLRDDHPTLARYAAALKQRGRSLRALRRLLDMKRSYPAEPFLAAIEQALHYGLFDLGRVEALILKYVAGDFFRLPEVSEDDA